MKVFKFGGASVKDAEGVRNIARVLSQFPDDDILIVVSAMGKTTNALEEVVRECIKGSTQSSEPKGKLELIRSTHSGVLLEVAPTDIMAVSKVEMEFDVLSTFLDSIPSGNADRDYDQIVSYGELWSTLIVSAHLSSVGVANQWLDARDVVRTDETFREARIDWKVSEQRARETHLAIRKDGPLRIVTQGFIGCTADGSTTTLGREGSDFSAAIFAYLLHAESVTIWKDVPGMFNADPNRFADTELLKHISYREAIELSYFGASVIHPRTLQPLQKANIPLYIRSFADLEAPGSVVDDHSGSDSLIPSFIVKPDQMLVSITPRDLSFIVEENLSQIFRLFAKYKVRIDLMQNSALAFSVSVDDSPSCRSLIEELGKDYEVRYNEHCELVTVRHYDEATLEKLTAGREVLIEQRSRVTARFVLHDK